MIFDKALFIFSKLGLLYKICTNISKKPAKLLKLGIDQYGSFPGLIRIQIISKQGDQ